MEAQQISRNPSPFISHPLKETWSPVGWLSPPSQSAAGNTIAVCNLLSGGGSALNQPQSLTNRCNMGNTLPGQVRSAFQEIAIDGDKFVFYSDCTFWWHGTTLLPASRVGHPLCSCFAHTNLSHKRRQPHAIAQTSVPVYETTAKGLTPLREGLEHTRDW